MKASNPLNPINMYDYLLNQFVGYDTNRPAISKAATIDGYAYATITQVMIRIPVDQLTFHYDNPKFPASAPAMFDNIDRSDPQTVQVADIALLLSKVKIEYIKLVCKECKGTGEIECPCCGNNSECEKCNGTGRLDCIPIRIKEDRAHLKVGRSYYRSYNIDPIIQAALVERAETITIYENKLFEVGNLMILCMPLLD